MQRRTFLKILGGGAATAALSSHHMMRALADPAAGQNEFFIFIHAQGGWDVTVSLDPRNENKGLIDPATIDLVDEAPIKRWKNAPIEGSQTFAILTPPGSSMRFGPAIGDLYDLYDRLTVINGIAMNTVSHPDGTIFSATGRHLAGGRVPVSSIDTIFANEFGKEQLFPSISARFPSSLVGSEYDPRVTPLVVDSIGSIGKVLTRSNQNTTVAERDAVSVMLTAEAQDLAKIAQDRDVWQGMAIQYESLRKMLASNLRDTFDAAKLKLAQPSFNYLGKFQGANVVNAAFAVEAMKRNIVRCIGFQCGGHDTHNSNYKDQPGVQQEVFDMLATLLKVLDTTPHPTKTGAKLSDHTHILVVSDFCRTPQINIAGGRDHYPNNSSLIISPKFKGNTVFGKSDPDQLLPMDAKKFADGVRPVAPPDVLATMLGAFGVDPRKYMRDGDVINEILRT